MTILDRFTTAVASRYVVEREVGGSAIAISYLAVERQHDGQVVIKVVRPALAVTLDADRFVRELKHASQLQHPYIVPLYEWGEAENFLYYVTPWVEGDTLRERLRREKQLPVEDALQITREVATALNFAHAHHVTHRDIKPENILLPAGTAIVAEFGIAHAVVRAGAGRITPQGVGLGTPAYLSPEQTRGRNGGDGRSDIYSLACVLYEMLVGEPPFTGSTIERIVEQHRSADPPAVTAVRTVPSQVADGLVRALAKNMEERFATAAEFAEALTGTSISLAASGQEIETDRPHRGRGRWVMVALVLVSVAAALAYVLGFLG